MLRTLLFSTLLVATMAFAAIPLASANTGQCSFAWHDGQYAQVCVFDQRQGGAPECPGHFDATGFHVSADGVAQVYGSGYQNRCWETQGRDDQGVFLVVNEYIVAWEDGMWGPGQYGCFVYAGSMNGNALYSGPCPFPLPNPGWGHLIP